MNIAVKPYQCYNYSMTMKRIYLVALVFLTTTSATLLSERVARAVEPVSARLTVDDAVRMARENNPRARKAADELRAADAKVTGARSGFLPQVSAKAGYKYQTPVSEMSFGGEPIKFMPYDNYDARVTAGLTLIDFGRTAKSVDIAKSGSTSAALRLDMTTRDLSYSAVQSFYAILFLKEAIQVQEKEIAALRKNLDFTDKRYKQGTSTRFDLLTTQVRLSAAGNRKIDLENELKNREISLRRLIGVKDEAPLAVSGSFDVRKADEGMSKLTTEALHQRPELMLAQENERAATYRKSLANSEGMPKIVGSVSYGTTNGYEPNLEEMRTNFSAGVELQIPIFTGFRTSAAQHEAAAMKHAAEEERIDTEEAVREEVAQSLNELKTSLEKIGTTELQVGQAELAASHARIRYQNGLATTLDLLDAESALAKTELGHLQARYEYVISSYRLRRAAGDLFRQ
jgi:outer membrane protein